jgi:hypothetical protein
MELMWTDENAGPTVLVHTDVFVTNGNSTHRLRYMATVKGY